MILAAFALVQADPVDALDRELLAATSATAVLQKRCAEPIRAQVDRAAFREASAEQRVRLRVGPAEPVAYRSVRLNCGDRTFSVAENWYVPSRLTPEMNAALAADTPFGVVIRPLAPTRRRLESEGAGKGHVLRHRALVMAADGSPLAEVAENYQPAVLGP